MIKRIKWQTRYTADNIGITIKSITTYEKLSSGYCTAKPISKPMKIKPIQFINLLFILSRLFIIR